MGWGRDFWGGRGAGALPRGISNGRGWAGSGVLSFEMAVNRGSALGGPDTLTHSPGGAIMRLSSFQVVPVKKVLAGV
jgi:hypothetical protein